MDDSSIPNYSLKDQKGEFINQYSNLSTFKNNILISYNNYVNFFDPITKEIIKRIGNSKKRIITTYCIFYDNFILGYNDGSINAFNSDNEKIFGFKICKKKIINISNTNETLIITTYNGYIYLYDFFKREIIKNYQKQKKIKKIDLNENYFIIYTNNKIKIFSYQKIDPIKILENLNLFDFLVLNDNLILLNKENEINFFDLKNLKFCKNQLKIKNAKELQKNISNNFFYVITPDKKINKFCIIQNKINNNEDLETLKIKMEGVIETSIYKMAILNGIFYIFTKNNKILKIEENSEQKNILSFHNSEIISIKIYKKFVFTISEDILIKWSITNNLLDLNNSLKFENKIKNFCFFQNLISLFDNQNLFFINYETFEIKNKIDLNDINIINSCPDYLAVGKQNKILIYDKELKNILEFYETSEIVFLKFSFNQNKFKNKFILLGVANLNNKINIYKLEKKNNNSIFNQIMSLYGHSLPVRYFDFYAKNTDFDELISCSADKTVKIWGNYGEIRKTFYYDTEKVKYLLDYDTLENENQSNYENKKENKNFLIANDDILSFKRFDLNRKFKNYGIKNFDFNESNLVACSERQIYLYSIDNENYFFSEEEEEDSELKIEDQENFDKLEKVLENIKNENKDFSNYREDLKYCLEKLDLAEIDNTIKLLDNNSLTIILEILEFIDEIFAIKIFISISKNHFIFMENNELGYKVYEKLFCKVVELRKVVKENVTKQKQRN